MADVTLTPAYGRDYQSKKAVIADFEADKDFIFNRFGDKYDGAYVNKAQLLEEGIESVWIRYKAKTKVCQVKVVAGTPVSVPPKHMLDFPNVITAHVGD